MRQYISIKAFIVFALLLVGQTTSILLSVYDVADTYAASGVQQVATGQDSACAVKNHVAYCWGSNQYGKLGINKTDAKSLTPVAVYADRSANPAAVMAGKSVQKVSVGASHACAIANAQLYCWGDNRYGQLGNRTRTSSKVPVVVDVNTGSNTVPKSALAQKEIIDVSAAENFTCALASDGTVACWGMGGSGQLGNNNTSDINYPVAVYTGGVFAGKKGVQLAKASNATMCVLAVDSTATGADVGNHPYCWGYGIDNGTGLPRGVPTVVTCSAFSPTVIPASKSVTTIFQSAKPVRVPGEALVAMDAGNATLDGGVYVTGLSTGGRAYYWGMYGYVGTTSASNTKSCSIRKCTGMAPGIRLASTKGDNNGKNGIQLARYNHSTGGNTPGGHNQQNSQGQNVGGGGNNSQSCTNITHYGYTLNTYYRFTGNNTQTTPPTWSSSEGGYQAVSGSVFKGLYCATTGGAMSCDAHGTDVMADGATGSGYVRQCTTTGSGIFKKTTCEPDPTGPQSVLYDGWLSGKTFKQLSTGTSGYTCAVTNDGTVGCWGVNTSGQLGDGTTVNKNIPTKVGL